VQHNSINEQSGSFNLSLVDKVKIESLGLHSDLLEFLENNDSFIKRLTGELPFVQSSPSNTLDKLSPEYQCKDLGYRNAKEQRLIQEYHEMASANFTYRNHSLDFDPIAAVHRQARFAEKMSQFNWLQSPTVTSTLRHAVDRYGKFFFLIANFPGMMVPTLDVDLVWHTHQLSPARYMVFSKATANGRFVDHNDRVEEEELHTGFQKVQDLYREKFADDYLLCHSWYCEAGRLDPDIALSDGDCDTLELLIERERARRRTLGLPVMMEFAECKCVSWQASKERGSSSRSPKPHASNCNSNCRGDCSDCTDSISPRPQPSHCSKGGDGCASSCKNNCKSSCRSSCSSFCYGSCGGG